MEIYGDPVKYSNIKYLKENPKEFYGYFNKRLNIMKNVKPNKVHNWIKQLENSGKLSMLVTQNIDNLHNEIKNKIELHGNAFNYYCVNCNSKYDNYDNLTCNCGGLIRPDIILFGEKLNKEKINQAINDIQNSDLFIVIGTSLFVSPANMLCTIKTNGKKILINKKETPYDYSFDIVMHGDLNDIF